MEWIKSQTDLESQATSNPKPFDPLLTVPNLRFDPAQMHDEIQALFRVHPPVAWRSQPPGAVHGLSLSYDPQAPEQEWHLGSFGHSRYQQHAALDYFKAPERDRLNATRGDYLDSLGFRKLLPAIEKLPALSTLLKSFNMPVVRCTVRVIDGTKAWPSLDDEGGMHQDDPPWEVLRVNLCITGSDDFGFQYAGHSPLIMRPGDNLIVNADHDHRVWVRQRSATQRMHLIVGLVPWIDYDDQADAWTLNTHAGHTHPYDLVRQGYLLR